MQLMAAVTDGESFEKTRELLHGSLGEIFVEAPTITTLDLDDDELDPTFDRAGLHSLKALLNKTPG